MRDRRAEYLQAALEVLDEIGPDSQSFGLTVAQVCHLTPLNRSVVYRHWDTIDDLNQDILVLTATDPTSWQPKLARAPIDLPLIEVLRQVLASPLEDLSSYALGLVAGWSPSHPMRPDVQTIERSRLDDLGRWLESHLAARGRQFHPAMDAHTVAVAVSAAIHGHLLIWLATSGFVAGPWTDDDRQVLAARLGRLLGEVTIPGPRRRCQPVLSPQPTWSPRQILLGDALGAVRINGPIGPWLPKPARLVSLARLGRRLGVHERRLYAMWPNASAMNAEILSAVAERERDLVDAVLRRAIAEGAQGQYRSIEELFIRSCEQVVRLPLESLGSHLFTCGRVLSDPVVHATFADRFSLWLDEMRTVFLAGLALAERTWRSDVDIDEAVASVREAAFGMRRLAAVHPELLDTTTLGRHHQPLAGVVPMLAVSAAVAPQPRGRGGGI